MTPALLNNAHKGSYGGKAPEVCKHTCVDRLVGLVCFLCVSVCLVTGVALGVFTASQGCAGMGFFTRLTDTQNGTKDTDTQPRRQMLTLRELQ